MTGTKTARVRNVFLWNSNDDRHTWIGNDLIGWEEKPPQRVPVVDLGLVAPGLQRGDDLLSDAVLRIRTAAVIRDAADIGLAEMRVQKILRGKPLAAPRADEGTSVPLDWRMVGTNVFSGSRSAS
jgi:hypothetical protein